MTASIIIFFTAAPPLELFLIMFFKAVEVTIGTLRNIMINRGFRRQGTCLSIIEILLWTFIASRVIMGITDAPVKGIAYAIGFSMGIYCGSYIEGVIALGRVLVQIIVGKDNAHALTCALRDKGYAVTAINAQGRDSDKTVLMVFANRRGKDSIIREIRQLDDSAMIVTNDVSALHGGTIAAAKKLFK
jgi:uncharacterized protein YebE (UPF0316 family)